MKPSTKVEQRNALQIKRPIVCFQRMDYARLSTHLFRRLSDLFMKFIFEDFINKPLTKATYKKERPRNLRKLL